jgi:hypothetical protein
VSSQKFIETRADAIHNARAALALMSADLRGACPLAKKTQFIGLRRLLGDAPADNLDFGTHNYTPRHPREGDFCELSYFLETGPRPGQYTLWRRRDPTPDNEPLSGGSREEIAGGLLGLQFEYYDGWEWFDEWGSTESEAKLEAASRLRSNLSGMPEAVRITVWLDASARPAASPGREEQTPEPPLVFQTVARLNLAASSQRGSAGGASGEDNTASQPANPATTAPPAGGTP